MTDLVLIRHAPTDWNAQKRIQGRTDTALSAAGRALLDEWKIPESFKAFDWFCSPLQRTRDTATALGGEPSVAEVLIEMDWGTWEGRRLPELRAELGQEMRDHEDRGLDFRPPGGESPRDVQVRLRPWLQALTSATIAVTHKGVIRAVYALAVDWDLTGKPPQKLADSTLHHFRLDATGHPAVIALNVPLHGQERKSA